MQDSGALRTRVVAASFLVAALLLTVLPCCAQADEAPSAAPLSPGFVRYAEDVASGRMQTLTSEGYPLGAIPSPVDLSHVKGAPSDGWQTLSLPATYDLRTTGKLTPVKNQGSCGSCWTFAAYGSMESILLPAETRDFSENNMKNLSGFDIPCCDGGNHFMSTAYLTRWDGPVSESSDPYNAGSCTSPTGLPVQKHVQQVLFPRHRSSSTDNDFIKQAVMTYGAFYTTMYWDSAYYKSATYAYYYPGSTVLNHAVCIVGWDDNFDRTKFLSTPPANGAFIIRNSWGPSWGQSGYFYISYYDTQIGRDNAVYTGNAPVTSYDQVYQYDPLGWVSNVGYSSNTGWAGNVFTASSSCRVDAAGFYASSPGTSYDAYIYLNPNSGPISTSGYASRQTGTLAEVGYQTIQFDSPVAVTGGQKFSIVVKLITPGYNYPIPFERPLSGYSSAANAAKGQSYISSNGTSWSDLTNSFAKSNVCVKAYATTSLGLAVTPSDGLVASGPVGGPMGPSITYTLSNASFGSINWTAGKTQPWVSLSAAGGTLAPGASVQVTVSVNSDANTLPAGTYGDTVSFVNTTTGIGNTTRAVTLEVLSARLAVEPAEDYVAKGGIGGPFGPSSKVYTVTNTGYGNLNWTASADQPWISVLPTGGVIGPQQQALVEVSVNSTANTLPEGGYSGTVAFANSTNGDGDCTRGVSLSVRRNYDLLPVCFNWIDPSTHRAFEMADDGATVAQTLPFAFTFYGVQYDQVYVGSNGLITLGTNSGAAEPSNTDIPNPQAPNAAVYPYWDDLNPFDGGSVRIGTDGSSPSRRYIISWIDVPHDGAFYARVTCQAILHETSNDITFQYLDVTPADMVYGAGRSATVGVEDEIGVLARKYSFNGSALLANNQAFMFTTNQQISLADAKRQPNGAPVTIRDAVVTGVFGSIFYVEGDDRSSGISVYKTSHGMTAGMRVYVTGLLSTNASGEKYINATSVTQTGTGTIAPLLLTNRQAGGADWEYDPVTGAGQKGIKDAADLNNIGMLICTTGKVTQVATGYFYLDDGSGAKDNTAYKGVKVSATGFTLPALDKTVKVCGASSCSKSGSDLYRLIRATSITVMDP